MKKRVAVIALLLATVMAAGCNTVKGMGEDIERAGEKVRGAAK